LVQLLVVRDEDTPPELLEATRTMVVEAFTGRFDRNDWDHGRGGWRALVLDDGVPVAHASLVPRELFVDDQPFRAGYVEAVGTAQDRWNQGLGSKVMTAIDDLIREHFELGALATSRHGFYGRLGWERWQGPSYVLRGNRRDRTIDEDAGLMVLRFGPSERLDLTESITCHERTGDDW
jgi:aminoglycoside 2'-N-acetyltransferase I